jgi:hypothetical protein
MLARFRSRLTFANVVSLMAPFVALGGGAYAMTIAKDSVGATQLNKNAVTDRSGDSWRRGKDRLTSVSWTICLLSDVGCLMWLIVWRRAGCKLEAARPQRNFENGAPGNQHQHSEEHR